MNQRITDKLVRNTFFNTMGFTWDFVIRFVLVAYIVARLGQTRSAIWAFVSILTAQFSLLDFGVESSFVKYIAEYHARKSHGEINRVVSTGFAFYLALGLVLTVAVCFGGEALVRLSSLEPSLASEAVAALRLAVIAFALANLARVFESLFNGLQRMEITNLVRIAVSVPYVAFTILFLEREMGIWGLMLRDALVAGIQLVAVAACAFKVLPELRVRPIGLVDRRTFRRLFSFGIKVHVSRISLLVNLHFDKLLVTGVLDRSFAAGLVLFYELATKALTMARMLPALLVSATLPATSELAAQGDSDRVFELFRRSTKYVMFVGAPMMAVVILAAPALMAAWMGPGYGLSARAVQILAVGYLALCLGGAVGQMVQGIGRPGIQVKAALFALLIHIVLSVVMVFAFGFYGVLVGTALALVASLLYYYVAALKPFGRAVAPFCADVFWKPLVACLVAGALLAGLAAFLGITPYPTRLANIALVLVYTVAFSALYLALIHRLRYLDARDAHLARDGLRRVFGRFLPASRAHEPVA